jgi:hypothetical protein
MKEYLRGRKLQESLGGEEQIFKRQKKHRNTCAEDEKTFPKRGKEYIIVLLRMKESSCGRKA